MKTLRGILVLALLLPSAALADASAGIFAILDEVRLEPSELEPDRVRLIGVFAVPQPISSGLHRPPVRGELYFGVNPGSPGQSRSDWEALRAAAGTGEVVAFAEYWMPGDRRALEAMLGRLPESAQPGASARSSINTSLVVTLHTSGTPVLPEPYPRPNARGVITSFDDEAQLCPRFGASSSEIVAGLWQAHDAGRARPALPVCEARVGLLDNGALDSVFPGQPRDETWAVGAERLLGQRIADSGVQLTWSAIECRYTICHVQLAYPSVDYQNATGDRLTAAALRDVPGFVNGGRIDPSLNGEPTRGYWIQRRSPE